MLPAGGRAWQALDRTGGGWSDGPMRMGNLVGRLVIQAGDRAVDVERASGGRLPSDPAAAYDRWDELVDWARTADLGEGAGTSVDPADLGAPSPGPRQVFALALNYRDHAEENHLEPPEQPSVFTKFPSAVTGPHGDIALPDGNVDWEIELVAVIGRPAHRVAEADAWRHVAGLTVGQDVSERLTQFAGKPPQFSLAKSFPGFAAMGPWLVTPDELDDPDDLELGCYVNGEQVQKSRTSQLIFPVPAVVAYLSSIVRLLPGDVIYTGTPAGVGALRQPPRFLGPGDELSSYVVGIGEMRHRFVAS
jgi:2-keto-4-pentenoate hydratase/2-oxohepta-3-ene-1,7-dioic acid hydratase in catechol pathway